MVVWPKWQVPLSLSANARHDWAVPLRLRRRRPDRKVHTEITQCTEGSAQDGKVSHRAQSTQRLETEKRMGRVLLWIRLQPDVIDAVDGMACGHGDRLRPVPQEKAGE